MNRSGYIQVVTSMVCVCVCVYVCVCMCVCVCVCMCVCACVCVAVTDFHSPYTTLLPSDLKSRPIQIT